MTRLPRNPLDRIPALTAAELPGWWAAVMVLKVRRPMDGESAALMVRARELGIVERLS